MVLSLIPKPNTQRHPMTRTEALMSLAQGRVIRSRSMFIRLGDNGFETRFGGDAWTPNAIHMDHDDYVELPFGYFESEEEP